MSAQIIEFPMDRVKPVSASIARTSRQARYEAQAAPRVNYFRVAMFWLVVLGLIYAMLSSTFGAGQSAQATNTIPAASQAGHFKYVTVMQGDTMWSLASRYAPDRDSWSFISDVMALNNLSDSLLSPGQRLALPKN
jgi:LysM repeat protein